MTKLRVYEYAKQKNVSSKDVINKLKEMNIEVTNHMTALDDSTVNKLNDSIKPKNEDKAKSQRLTLRLRSTRPKRMKRALSIKKTEEETTS